ncbi:glycoside hydrolase family 15 protein [[Mycobacterium] nativiensis]|uniref:Glycoside hydrolase family 15 protein n=1 Tax=[Mycobacterium] nativiensis TaxID=2855503 RepID=A0ABU5XTF7_9MYCO|nr:glycoside hydrolase family 15 protein [Mycolicibacter sp. MYC340]MEB3031102.1 glycoside hydrolase family 15 protein [Mycolicibacter sp. MYC340]
MGTTRINPGRATRSTAAGNGQPVGRTTSSADTGALDVPSSTRSPYPPIDDYAFLSDCESTCLIAPNGAVEWMCLPRPDSPSVFGAILDRGAGHFRVGPYGQHVPSQRVYRPGGLIVETTWQTDTGWLTVHDCLVMGRWHNTDKRSRTHRRAPTDWDAGHILLRTIKCVNGTVEVEVSCEPAFDYHRREARWEYTGQVYEEATATCKGDSHDGHLGLKLTSNLRLGIEGPEVTARTRMTEGDQAFVALSWSPLPAPQTQAEALRKLAETSECWREWITIGRFPDHPWRGYLQQSALALKGLTYAPTGALMAASTTSLPETPGGVRNWDYRYAWVRDSTFALWGLHTLGLDREANNFFHFLSDAALDADGQAQPLQVMYGVGGEKKLTETELGHLSGYDGAQPVRIGNGAYKQRQHDVWGAMLDSVYLHARSHGEHVPEQLWPVLKKQVEQAIENWQLPDHGIWEVRGEPQHFVSSKVYCWVALDRGAKLAMLHGEKEYARQWAAIADDIKADILAHGADERGVFTQSYGSAALDASVLLIPLLRFLPPEDPRVRATVLAIADELTVDGLVLRYKVAETDDGLVGEEGTFTICSFWLVSALVEIGELKQAKQLCERLLAFASPLRLYAEEIDTRTGRHLGNFPQAFTHLALINAVVHVIRAEEDVAAGEFLPAN